MNERVTETIVETISREQTGREGFVSSEVDELLGPLKCTNCASVPSQSQTKNVDSASAGHGTTVYDDVQFQSAGEGEELVGEHEDDEGQTIRIYADKDRHKRSDRAQGIARIVIGPKADSCPCHVDFMTDFTGHVDQGSKDECPNAAVTRAWNLAMDVYATGDPKNTNNVGGIILGRPIASDGKVGLRGGSIGSSIPQSAIENSDGSTKPAIATKDNPLSGLVVRYRRGSNGHLVPVGFGYLIACKYWWNCKCIKTVECNPAFGYKVWGSSLIKPSVPAGYTSEGGLPPDSDTWTDDEFPRRGTDIFGLKETRGKDNVCCNAVIDCPGHKTATTAKPLSEQLDSEENRQYAERLNKGNRDKNRQNEKHNASKDPKLPTNYPTDYAGAMRYNIILKADIQSNPEGKCDRHSDKSGVVVEICVCKRKKKPGETHEPDVEIYGAHAYIK